MLEKLIKPSRKVLYEMHTRTSVLWNSFSLSLSVFLLVFWLVSVKFKLICVEGNAVTTLSR